MNTKLKILCAGNATYVELDGKTIGKGVDYIEFAHDARNDSEPRCLIGINLKEFEFMPDGRFEEVSEWLKKAEPPENTSGRLE